MLPCNLLGSYPHAASEVCLVGRGSSEEGEQWEQQSSPVGAAEPADRCQQGVPSDGAPTGWLPAGLPPCQVHSLGVGQCLEPAASPWQPEVPVGALTTLLDGSSGESTQTPPDWLILVH